MKIATAIIFPQNKKAFHKNRNGSSATMTELIMEGELGESYSIEKSQQGREAVYWPVPVDVLETAHLHGVCGVVRVSPPFGECRLTFMSNSRATTTTSRGSKGRTIACLVVGQHQNKVTRIGLGNPHFKSLHTTSLLLPMDNQCSQLISIWFAVHPVERVITCGLGEIPDVSSSRLTFPLAADEAARVELGALAVSNWESPIRVQVQEIRRAPCGFARSGNKFTRDGCLVHFPGNTIVCPVPRQSPWFNALVRAQQVLRDSPLLSSFFGFLPPSSLHMTVCELNSSVYSRSKFSKHISKDDWDDCYVGTKQRLKPLLEDQTHEFHMTVAENALHHLTSVRLVHHDTETDERLLNFRKTACELAGFEYDANYAFHITLAYPLYHFNHTQTQLWEEYRRVQVQMRQKILVAAATGPLVINPQLTIIRDMGCFIPY